MLQQKHYAIYIFKKPDAVLKQTSLYGPDFRNLFNQTPLMVAAWTGNATVIEALIEQGADTEKVDENGLTAFQIALSQAGRDANYARKKLAAIYDNLEPTSMSIKVSDRLIKLDKRQMELFMLNMMIALFYRVLPRKIIYHGGTFSTQDFIDAIEHMPASVLPERRKKRAYLSSILSKNEIDRDDKHNRKLFYRLKRGYYLFNPDLSIKVEGEWINIYDLLSLDKLTFSHKHDDRWWLEEGNERAAKIMKYNKKIFKEKIAKKRAELKRKES